MKDLIEKLKNQGLSDQQIEQTFIEVYKWLETTYPVFAKISKQTFIHELQLSKEELDSSVEFAYETVTMRRELLLEKIA